MSSRNPALAEVGVDCSYGPAGDPALLPGRAARIEAGGSAVGLLGEVHPRVREAFDIEQPVMLFELDLPRLLPHVPERRPARPVSRFPAVEQDLAVVEARIFDLYTGEQVPEGTRSLAFSIRYQAPDRTLTGEEARGEQERIVAALAEEFGARLR